MGALRCKGRVTLQTGADMKKWGLVVLVAFRADQEPVQLGDTQSGGERAVSTMLFLLAMQHTTPLPFRVVDEINQGPCCGGRAPPARALWNTIQSRRLHE